MPCLCCCYSCSCYYCYTRCVRVHFLFKFRRGFNRQIKAKQHTHIIWHCVLYSCTMYIILCRTNLSTRVREHIFRLYCYLTTLNIKKWDTAGHLKFFFVQHSAICGMKKTKSIWYRLSSRMDMTFEYGLAAWVWSTGENNIIIIYWWKSIEL